MIYMFKVFYILSEVVTTVHLTDRIQVILTLPTTSKAIASIHSVCNLCSLRLGFWLGD